MTPGAFVDTHVHLHPRFDPAEFLDALPARDAVTVLMLAEPAGVHRFAELRDAARAGPWTIALTADPDALHATRDARAPVVLVAGRQINTAERVEVLALATTLDFDDRRPLADTLAAVLDAGALAVIPWGFGKWWGARGRLVTQTLQARPRPGLALGDNRGRPALAPPHPAFRLARARSIPVLPGSDPLDLDHHRARAATYGFVLRAALPLDHPAVHLRAAVRTMTASPERFGRRVGPLRFAIDQAMLRLPRGGPR